ncbi:MAG: hypothetical protein ABJN69_01995 [Hellea sp.]
MSDILTHKDLNNLATVRNRLEKEENLRIQFSSPSEYNSMQLNSINDLAREFPEQITLRFWHHLGDSFDFKILNQLPNICNLWLDPIRAKNWEHFKSLPNLKYLSFGVLEITDKKILSRIVHQNLETLILSQMRTKALDLQYLEQAKNLKELRMFGHRKNISSISALKSLRTLIFSPSIQDSYPYITQLSNLKHLEFHLGGSESIDEVSSTGLKTLKFFQVKRLQDIGDLSRFPSLETIKVENQPLLERSNYSKKLEAIRVVNWD